MKRGRRNRLLWIVPLVGLASVLALRAFVGDVFRVSTVSMRPTLVADGRTPEYVLVLYGAPRPLERFDLVVIEREGEGTPLVKRVAGLPHEAVQIAAGDLWIDGRRLPAEVPRAAEVPVYDSRVEPLSERFHFKGPEAPGGGDGPWMREDAAGPSEVWRLDALELGRGDNRAKMFLVPDVTTTGLTSSGPDPQWLQVNDLSVAARFELLSFGAGAEHEAPTFVAELREAGDVFHARWTANLEGGLDVELERTAPDGETERLARTALGELGAGWHELRFSNRDDQLTLELDGLGLLATAYDRNRDFPGHTPAGISSVGPRVALGGSRCSLRITDVRIARDLYWTAGPRFGSFGGTQRVQLGPDEVFVLGDNTLDSTDSRFFGPLRLSELKGRPIAVVWPLDRARWLP